MRAKEAQVVALARPRIYEFLRKLCLRTFLRCHLKRCSLRNGDEDDGDVDDDDARKSRLAFTVMM